MPDLKSICTELLRLDAEATGGPWDKTVTIEFPDTYVIAQAYGAGLNLMQDVYDAPNKEQNMEFIPYLRNNAPAIARRCLELEDEVARLKALVPTESFPEGSGVAAFQAEMEQHARMDRQRDS